MSVVALGSAVIVLASQYPGEADQAAASRVMQGIVTGIGFLGADVIIHHADEKRVRGLTTAATIWLTACLGAACGAGAWALILMAGILVAIILAAGRLIERAAERLYGRVGHKEDKRPHATVGEQRSE